MKYTPTIVDPRNIILRFPRFLKVNIKIYTKEITITPYSTLSPFFLPFTETYLPQRHLQKQTNTAKIQRKITPHIMPQVPRVWYLTIITLKWLENYWKVFIRSDVLFLTFIIHTKKKYVTSKIAENCWYWFRSIKLEFSDKVSGTKWSFWKCFVERCACLLFRSVHV